jgi:hypothetical protein
VLKSDNSKHGNLTLGTIFLAESRYKTYHPDVLKPTAGDNITKFHNKQKHYASPEIVKNFQNNNGQQKTKLAQGGDATIADIYSLGLILLELCSMQPEKDFYRPDLSVNKELIQSKLTEISSQFSNEFMEMVIRMLTIDPANRVTAEELVELTSLKQGITSARRLGGQRVFITPNSQMSSSKDIPSFPQQVSAQNIQFKQSPAETDPTWSTSSTGRNNTATIEQRGQPMGLMRSASGKNLFDPDIMNRVNQNRNVSRQPDRGRDVSPVPPLPPMVPQVQPQRPKIETSAISTSRIKRGDMSKSPLRKVYGSNTEPDIQPNPLIPHTQSMQHINTPREHVQTKPSFDPVAVNLNQMFPYHQSERQITQQVPNPMHSRPQFQFHNPNPITSTHFSNPVNPPQHQFPIQNSTSGFNSNHNTHYVPPIHNNPQFGVVQQPLNLTPRSFRQEVVRTDVSPIQVQRHQPPLNVISTSNISPISGRYAKVTRYSVDKNGQRTLIESGPEVRTAENSHRGGFQPLSSKREEIPQQFHNQNFQNQPNFALSSARDHHNQQIHRVSAPPAPQPSHEVISPRPQHPIIVNEPVRGVSPIPTAPVVIRS